jgi:CheY-like chemotaxis protein
MIIILKTSLGFLALAAFIALCPRVIAQPPEDPAAVPTAAADDAGPPLETDAAVLAALELPREEPADFFQAIIWLIELDRPELAKPILDELVKLEVTDAQRAALVEEFGSRSMLLLARTKELGPAGVEFADVCTMAAANAASDPQRLATLIQQVVGPSSELRQLAANDLAAAGQAGVKATLEALARETDPNRRAALAGAAVRMDPLLVGPLLAMLSTNDAALRGEVSQLLTRLGATQAAPFLAASSASAERPLEEAIGKYSAGTPPFAPDEANHVELWHWNDATKQLVAARYPQDEARVIWTARLARALAQLQPGNRNYQRQAWLLGAESAGLIGTSNDLFTAIDSPLIDEVLAEALERDYAHAAIAAANELGRRGDVQLLQAASGQPSPLANALAHSNRRVRFAALSAIMAMDPPSPYAGSSRVPEALAWFAGSTGERHALVAMPTNVAATDLAGMLAANGVSADATNRGRDAVDMARQNADLEMIFVDIDILLPGIRQVLYELRANEETGQVPIAILAADGQLEAAERLANEHDRVIAVPRLHTKEIVARTVADLSVLAGRDWTSPEERAEQALQAIHWVESLISKNRKFYELDRATPAITASLYHANASEPAIASLTRLGPPASQRTLVSFASQTALPSAGRLQAAAAFHKSVAENGLLLTSDEILAQYDRYNASANSDPQTQQILGALLDAIESRRDAERPVIVPAP